MGIERDSRIFVQEALARVAKEPTVLDIGGGEPLGKWMKPYRPLFKNTIYRSFDYDASTGADVVGDIHALPLQDASIDAIICSSVLEHVRDPLQAMREIHRVLKPGGKLFLYVPSTYPYHARKGHYPDYWRFFGDTIELLLEGFSSREVHKRGGYFLALSFFVPGQHRIRGVLEPLAYSLDTLFRTSTRSTTAGFFAYAVK